MALSETLIVSLGVRFGKLLLKNYLEEPGEIVGAELLDIAKGKIKDTRDQREARRQFESLGDRIAEQLLPAFQAAAQRGDLNAEAVVFELANALDALPTTVVVKQDLEPAKIVAEMERVHPLPRAQFSVEEQVLYQRALIDSVRYIVEVAAKLPRFEVAQVRESLQRLSRLGDVVEDTAQRVRRIEAWVARQGDDSTQRFEMDYRLAVLRNLDYVELFGADLSLEARRQSLSNAYVSLSLEFSEREDSVEFASLPATLVLDSLEASSNRLLIRGEAGSGKSTLFRWIAIEASKGRFQRNLLEQRKEAGSQQWILGAKQLKENAAPASWRMLVPFLIRLRDCRMGRLPSPNDFPGAVAKDIGTPPVDWVRTVLQSGRGLVLLDGIDEVPDVSRDTVRREIDTLVRAYPQCSFIVSTKPEAVPKKWLAYLGFREVRVSPMSDLGREALINKWHEALAIELGLMGKPHGDIPRLAEELKKKLSENPPISRLTTNPLLCAMICALHRDRGQKLPENQYEILESLCQVLLQRRDIESGLDMSQFPEPYRRLGYPQKKAILQGLAHFMVLNGEPAIRMVRAQEKVGETLRALSGQSETDADVIYQALVERSGMLYEVEPGYFTFVHSTFKEFLAAERFADSSDIGLLSQRALDVVWQRVILFAVATSRQGFASDLIRRLLVEEVGASFQGELQAGSRARQLLALQCGANALFIDPDLQAVLKEIALRLVPPKSMAEAEALSATGELAVHFLGYREDYTAKETACCVRSLRLIGTSYAKRILEGYLHDTRLEVVEELAQAVNPLQIRAVESMLLEGLLLPPSIASQVWDLSPLVNRSDFVNLDLSRTQVSDLSPLASLAGLKSLRLSATPVVDISALRNSCSLENLDLSFTLVHDLSPLSNLRSLSILNLWGTQVSDLEPLQGLSNLRQLDVTSTRVADLSPVAELGELMILGPSARLDVDTVLPYEEDFIASVYIATGRYNPPTAVAGNLNSESTPCTKCGAPILYESIRRRRGLNFSSIRCSVCEAEFLLSYFEAVLARGSIGEEVSGLVGLNEEEFDVFISYNSDDGGQAEGIARKLQARGLKPWLDIWSLRPGLPWQRVLENVMPRIKAAAVLVGKKGMGPWQDFEQEAFLRQFVKSYLPVIPVILPDCEKEPTLPVFLSGMTWVDFRVDEEAGLRRLVWGVTGRRNFS